MDNPDRPDGWVLLRPLAGSINRVDLYMRDNGAGITHELPQTLGLDAVGEVIESDPGLQLPPRAIGLSFIPMSSAAAAGTACGATSRCASTSAFSANSADGTFTEVLAAPEASLLPLSPEADLHQAATLGVAYLTAWRMIFGKAPIFPGSTVPSSGRRRRRVLRRNPVRPDGRARGSSPPRAERNKIRHFQELGVEVVDYRKEEIAKAVLALTEGTGVDLVIDNVGEKPGDSPCAACSGGGHLVTCGATTGGHPSAEMQRLFIRQLNIHGSTMGSFEEFRRVVAAFENGTFQPPIDSVFPLDRIHDAFDRMEHPERIGKVVVEIAASP